MAVWVSLLSLFAVSYELGRRDPKLNNGGYQTDNWPVIRIPGLPPDMEIQSIMMGPSELAEKGGIVRCVEFRR